MMSAKFRYQDQQKIKIGGRNCISTKVFELEDNDYCFVGVFHIPANLPKKNWDSFVQDELYYAEMIEPYCRND